MEREILEALGLFIIGAPLLSLSVRLALKPMVDAVLQLRAAFETLSPSHEPLATARLAQLEEEVSELRSQLRKADEGLEFERKLHDPSQHRPASLPGA
jgi:hypothetical protein